MSKLYKVFDLWLMFSSPVFLSLQPLPKGLKFEILKASKDSKSRFGQGTVVKVMCELPYTSNISPYNNTIKCIKGQWKPDVPKCFACQYYTVNHYTTQFSGKCFNIYYFFILSSMYSTNIRTWKIF